MGCCTAGVKSCSPLLCLSVLFSFKIHCKIHDYPPPPRVNPYHQLGLPDTDMDLVAQVLDKDAYDRAYSRSIFQKCKSCQNIMTLEELNEYHRLVKERDGFDVAPS